LNFWSSIIGDIILKAVNNKPVVRNNEF